MEHKLENGYRLTDEEIECRAEEWENDTWTGPLAPIAIGRPRLRDEEESVIVSFRLPQSSVDEVERVRANHGLSKSDFYRQAVAHELAALAS